jgi:hypothetical protein
MKIRGVTVLHRDSWLERVRSIYTPLGVKVLMVIMKLVLLMKSAEQTCANIRTSHLRSIYKYHAVPLPLPCHSPAVLCPS